MKNLHRVLCLSALILTASQLQAGVINTVTPFTNSWSPFGEPNTATYGETFTAPVDNVLDSFSLYLVGAVADPVDFRAYVYAWDGLKATGPQLFQSSAQSFTGSINPTEFAFTTGGITLSTGTQYVAFINATYDGINSTANMPASGFYANVYSGGDFVYYNNSNNFSLLTTNTWDFVGGAGDVWFKADFSPSSPSTVPEPSSIAIWGIGALGCCLVARRRKNLNA